MDCPEGNTWIQPAKLWLTLALKIVAVIVALWLINVAFVAVHEAGHATVASAFGASVYNVMVSPAGIDGSTTHTMLPERYQTGTVLVSGIIFSTIASVIAYIVRLDIAVYILGLRTFESAINYSQNSDMWSLYVMLGESTLLITSALCITIILVVASTFHRRYTASKPVEVRDGLNVRGPTTPA